MALNAFATSRFDKAQWAFAKILELDPDRPGVRFNLGLAKVTAKKFAEARQCFQEELARHGDSQPLQKALAETAYRMGDRAAAREHYRNAAATSQSTKERNFCARRADLCEDLDAFAQAIKAHGLLDQADELLQNKNYERAEKLFRQACRLDPTCFQALNNIGAIRLAQKDFPGARDHFLRADALVDLPMVTNNLKYLARQGVAR